MRGKINIRRYFQVLGGCLAVMLVAFIVCLGMNFLGTSGIEEGLTEEEIATVEASGGKINVLAMGVDKDGLRTDAIMLVSYDTEANTIKALSIPRDTRMYIGSRYQKINAAHALGASSGKILGAQGTVEAVSRLTAVPINYYIDFSFDAVAKCIDALGPVEFEIPDLNNDGVGMVYDDPAQDLHINLKPGLQELNGEQCVHLLRYRKGNKINGVRRTYANGDIDRIAVQQDFVKALVDQKLNASLILKLPSIFKQLSSEINTNLTVKDVLKYSKYLADFSSTNVSIFSLPGNFSGGEYDASYWICDLEATRELIETEFGYDASDITIDKVATKKVASDSDTDDDKEVKQTSKTTKSSSSKTSTSSSSSSKNSSSSSSSKSSSASKSASSVSDDDDNKSSTTSSNKSSSTATKKPVATAKPTPLPTQKSSNIQINPDGDDDDNISTSSEKMTVEEKKQNIANNIEKQNAQSQSTSESSVPQKSDISSSAAIPDKSTSTADALPQKQ